jgi:hypothetical protein
MLDAAKTDIADHALVGAGYIPCTTQSTCEHELIIIGGGDIVKADRDYKGISQVHVETIITSAAADAYRCRIRKGLACDYLAKIIVNDNQGIDRVDVIETQGQVIVARGYCKSQVGRQQETGFQGFELKFAGGFSPFAGRKKTFCLRQERGYQSFQLTVRKKSPLPTRL